MADVAQFPDWTGLVTSTPLCGFVHGDLAVHSYVLKFPSCDWKISTGVLYKLCLSYTRPGP